MRTRHAICGRAAQSLEAAVYGLANESARPTTFGDETVAVLIPCECERGEGERRGRGAEHGAQIETQYSKFGGARAARAWRATSPPGQTRASTRRDLIAGGAQR